MGKTSRPTHIKPRQIVGFSLDPELASEVKAEAGRRNIALKKLFEELWAAYKKNGKPKSP